MNQFARWTSLASTLGFLALAAVAGADEEKISVKSLPKAVIKAVKAKFPKAEIEEAAKEEEDGETIYEVSLEVKDQTIDVALKPDGTILEIERAIPVDKLPEEVKIAARGQVSWGKIEKVEQVTKGEHGPVHYEVAVTSHVTLTAKGKVIEAEEEDEEDEKPAAKGGKSKKDDDKIDDDDDEHKKPSAKTKNSKKGGKDEDDDN